MTDELLRQYKTIVEFLGNALGPNYEVTLHDLSTESSGIVAIANGEISGRSLGSPVTNVALQMLAQKEYETSDYKLNYTGQLASGKTIRSSTMFIKDHNGKPVGLLCVNFDDTRFHELSEQILKTIHPEEFVRQHYMTADVGLQKYAVPEQNEPAENYYNDLMGLMKEIFDSVSAKTNVAPERLNQQERIAFISSLNDRGIFRLKGAVQYVADRMACSHASVYRYLSKVRGETAGK